jgi:hypothetical protein
MVLTSSNGVKIVDQIPHGHGIVSSLIDHAQIFQISQQICQFLAEILLITGHVFFTQVQFLEVDFGALEDSLHSEYFSLHA